MENRRPLTHHLMEAIERPPDWTAVRFKRHKTWLSLNWKDYYSTCEALALGLADLGVERGDRVALLSNTRFEWSAFDLAILGLGAVTVPVYQSNRAEEVEFVLQNSTPRVLIVEDSAQLKKWESIAKRCRSVTHVICIQSDSELGQMALSWDDILNRGLSKLAQDPQFFQNEIKKTKLGDTATIVYTSGTTGEPRGALLTHEQILSEVEDVARAFPISPLDSTLSFLPYAHVLGRVDSWLNVYAGYTLNFAESIDRLKKNLQEVRPTVIIGVPRIFEKIYSGLLTQIEGHPLRKRLFQNLQQTRSWWGRQLADKLIYSALRQGLGGRLRFVVSGGAPLEPRLADFFARAGILILEGYGLTETTAAITTNTPDLYEFGTVGRPMADVEIKIADDGEILVKSKKVFRGYHQDPAATANAFQGEYFCTGDIGEFTDRGFLRITDRKKDLIKTAGGKYIAPQKLEGLLKLSPLISHALIHGDRRKYIVALITLNESHIRKLAKEKAWSYRDLKSLSQMPEVHTLVRQHIAQINAQLASIETIKNFCILPEDFTIEKGELTPSLKVKRRVVDEKFRETVNALYQ